MVDIIPFGEGRKPSRDILARIMAAKARLPEHDPLHDVLDAFVALVERIDATERSAAPTASAFNDDQMKSLVYQTERAAERGVGIYAKRIASWHQAIVGGAFAAGLTIGIMGTFYVASRQSAAEIEAMRLSVPAVLAAIPAADLAEWTTLIRSNPSPHALIANGRMVPQPTGQKAATITVWTEPATALPNH
jgi:hypothetical protein